MEFSYNILKTHVQYYVDMTSYQKCTKNISKLVQLAKFPLFFKIHPRILFSRILLPLKDSYSISHKKPHLHNTGRE